MSEYTKYFAVKSNSEKDVREKLNQANILSIVNADKDDYWFTDDTKRNGIYQWVTVDAPANSGFKNGEFFYEERFDDLGKLFDVFLLFFQEEDLVDWSLDIKCLEYKKTIKVYRDEKIDLSNKDIEFLENVFDKKWSELKPFLTPEMGMEFLNFVGIPYMEMDDQDKVDESIVAGDTYSILASELYSR